MTETQDPTSVDAGETDQQRAVVHKHLARALYGKTISGTISFDETGNQIIEHYRQVMTHHVRLDADDYFRMGRILELQKREQDALRYYHLALDNGVTNALDLRKHIIILSRDRLKVGPENINTKLDSYLVDMGAVRLDLRFWAIEEKLDLFAICFVLPQLVFLGGKSRCHGLWMFPPLPTI